MVERVVPDGPAYKAGLHDEDVIDMWSGDRLISKAQWIEKVVPGLGLLGVQKHKLGSRAARSYDWGGGTKARFFWGGGLFGEGRGGGAGGLASTLLVQLPILATWCQVLQIDCSTQQAASRKARQKHSSVEAKE